MKKNTSLLIETEKDPDHLEKVQVGTEETKTMTESIIVDRTLKIVATKVAVQTKPKKRSDNMKTYLETWKKKRNKLKKLKEMTVLFW